MAYDWLKIKTDYFTTPLDTTLEHIAEKYGVNKNYLYEVASKEKWKEEKDKIWRKSEEKLIQKMPETIAEIKLRHARIGKAMQSVAIKALQDGMLLPRSFQDLRVAINVEREALGLNEKDLKNEDHYEEFKKYSFIFDMSMEELKRFNEDIDKKISSTDSD